MKRERIKQEKKNETRKKLKKNGDGEVRNK